jgi:hypothetical protein
MNVRVIGTPREVEQVQSILAEYYQLPAGPKVYAARGQAGCVRVYLDLRPLGSTP